jgi:hypothetical protein
MRRVQTRRVGDRRSGRGGTKGRVERRRGCGNPKAEMADGTNRTNETNVRLVGVAKAGAQTRLGPNLGLAGGC